MVGYNYPKIYRVSQKNLDPLFFVVVISRLSRYLEYNIGHVPAFPIQSVLKNVITLIPMIKIYQSIAMSIKKTPK